MDSVGRKTIRRYWRTQGIILPVLLSVGGMLAVPSYTPAGIWGPHTLEDRLRDTEVVVLGTVLPPAGGEGTHWASTPYRARCQQSIIMPNPPPPAFVECLIPAVHLRVQESLYGGLTPGAQITIVVPEERFITLSSDFQKGSYMLSSGAPRFKAGEPVLVFLAKPKTLHPEDMTDQIYQVVEGETGKWSVYPDGILEQGMYRPGPRQIPRPLTKQEAWGPRIPGEEPSTLREVTPSEYLAYRRVGSHLPLPAESLAKDQPVWNTGIITLEEMRQVILRFKQTGGSIR